MGVNVECDQGRLGYRFVREWSEVLNQIMFEREVAQCSMINEAGTFEQLEQ